MKKHLAGIIPVSGAKMVFYKRGVYPVYTTI